MPKLVPEILGMWGGEVFIFPNLMILPQAGNAMIYRVRPNRFDPDSCTFEILSTRTDGSVEPSGEGGNRVVECGSPQCIPQARLGELRHGQLKVLADRSVEDVGILGH